MVERLQVKACSIGRILTSLEKKYSNSRYDETDMKKSQSGQLSNQPPSKRAQLKIQSIPPFNANKIKKSPSTEPAVSSPLSAMPTQKNIPEETEQILKRMEDQLNEEERVANAQ